GIRVFHVTGVKTCALPILVLKFLQLMGLEEHADILEGELRYVFAAPIGQRRANRLGVLVAWNVVAAEAAIATQGSLGDVVELLRSEARRVGKECRRC